LEYVENFSIRVCRRGGSLTSAALFSLGTGGDESWAPVETLKGLAEGLLGRLSAVAIVEGLKKLFARMKDAIRRTPQPRKDALVCTLSGKLDELADALALTFELGAETSLLTLLFRVQPNQQVGPWREVHSSLTVLTSWFHNWNAQRWSDGKRLTPEGLVNQIEGLSDIVLFTGWAGVEIANMARALPPGDLSYRNFKVAAQRYDGFLNDFEGFLRKLSKEFDLNEDVQFFIKERVFLRISP